MYRGTQIKQIFQNEIWIKKTILDFLLHKLRLSYEPIIRCIFLTNFIPSTFESSHSSSSSSSCSWIDQFPATTLPLIRDKRSGLSSFIMLAAVIFTLLLHLIHVSSPIYNFFYVENDAGMAVFTHGCSNFRIFSEREGTLFLGISAAPVLPQSARVYGQFARG